MDLTKLEGPVSSRPGMHLSRIWSDDELVELRVRVSDGPSSFSNQVYVGHSDLARLRVVSS